MCVARRVWTVQYEFIVHVCFFCWLSGCLSVCLSVCVSSGEHVSWNFSIHWNFECPDTREFPGADFKKWSGERTEVRMKSHAERALHSSAYVPPLVIRHVRCVFKYDGYLLMYFVCLSVCLCVCLCCLSVCLSVCVFVVCLSVRVSVSRITCFLELFNTLKFRMSGYPWISRRRL